MRNSVLRVALGFAILGCSRAPFTPTDRSDAKTALQQLDPGIHAIQFEQANPGVGAGHTGPVSAVSLKRADETRDKYKSSHIEPEVSALCGAITYYWSSTDGKGDKAKDAAAQVEKAKAALQSISDGK